MAGFLDVLGAILGGMTAPDTATQQLNAAKALREQQRLMFEGIDAADTIRRWQDERFATRYVAPLTNSLALWKQAGGGVADYAAAQLDAIRNQPEFQAMSPERQRLILDKFRQNFRSEMEVAKAAGDNETYMNITKALGLPSNNDYVKLMAASGNHNAVNQALTMANPFVQRELSSGNPMAGDTMIEPQRLIDVATTANGNLQNFTNAVRASDLYDLQQADTQLARQRAAQAADTTQRYNDLAVAQISQNLELSRQQAEQSALALKQVQEAVAAAMTNPAQSATQAAPSGGIAPPDFSAALPAQTAPLATGAGVQQPVHVSNWQHAVDSALAPKSVPQTSAPKQSLQKAMPLWDDALSPYYPSAYNPYM